MKYFESRHIQQYLNITKDQLLHWVQTRRLIKPAKEGKGRGGRSKFSFENLLSLSLIKELSDFGVELHSIKAILKGKKAIWELMPGEDLPKKGSLREKKSPWQFYKEKRELHEKEGFWLIIEKIENEFYWTYQSGEEGMSQVKFYLKISDLISSKAKMIVSISGIVSELEKMTGMKI